MDNHTIAEYLRTYARELARDEGDLYRVRAYRRAADTVETLDELLAELVAREGRKGLQSLPGIGAHLALTLERLVRTGEFHPLIPQTVRPEEHVSNLDGVGPVLTARLEECLGVTTVAELHAADRGGRLAQLGLSDNRLQKLRQSLEKYEAAPAPVASVDEPGIGELLRIDAEYREQAGRGELPTIAPQRFNPEYDSWLPLYYVRRGGWRYRALFSNTALAHRLGRTHDWVVIYFDSETASGQRAVVTETRGDLRGLRVVRGREAECRRHYQQTARAG
jgi:hypothetical protein